MNLIIGSLITFFLGVWKKVAALIAIVLVTYSLGFYMGYQNHKSQDLAREKEIVYVQVEGKQEKQNVADSVGVKREEAKTKIEVKYVEVEKKVIEYIPMLDRSCPDLGADWVRLYNESAAGIHTTP